MKNKNEIVLYQREEAKDDSCLADKQGNPLNADGTLKVEQIASIDDLTDDDFTKPTRSVQLPPLPENIDKAIGANGKPVVIKKNVFEKNKNAHSELTAHESKEILCSTLYSPAIVGQSQPITRPHYWVAIESEEGKSVTVLEVNNKKYNVEIVGWHKLDRKGLEKLRRQAEREDGQLLIQTSLREAAAALSTLPSELPSSTGKDTTSKSNNQTKERKSTS